jgi:hypothetical protein
MRRPVIHISEILSWADAFRKKHGRWPRRDDGAVAGVVDLTWCGVDQALIKGHRGLVKGQTLARLLLEERHRRHRNYLPPFTVKKILAWVDGHRRRTGEWPHYFSGAIEGASETWLAIDQALRNGSRGLPGHFSLAQLLEVCRGVRNTAHAPKLTAKHVLAWADDHKLRTSQWPTRKSGTVREALNETWAAIDAAFVAGSRGLGGYGSLARFLARRRGVRNRKALPKLGLKQIRAWAKAQHERTGRWPRHTSGAIDEAPGETWSGVNAALSRGWRGLPGGSTLHKVLKLLQRAS